MWQLCDDDDNDDADDTDDGDDEDEDNDDEKFLSGQKRINLECGDETRQEKKKQFLSWFWSTSK